MSSLVNKFRSIFLILGIFVTLALPKISYAYPVFAQQAYENPREATGRIVCANCHLAQKPTEIEVPQAVLPDTVFEAVVGIPYDLKSKQIAANGSKAGLNVGNVISQIAQKDVKRPEQAKEILEGFLKKKSDSALLQVFEGEFSRFLILKLK